MPWVMIPDRGGLGLQNLRNATGPANSLGPLGSLEHRPQCYEGNIAGPTDSKFESYE